MFVKVVGKFLNTQDFKWQWAVAFEYRDGYDDDNPGTEREIFETRSGARDYKRQLLSDQDAYIPANRVYNVRIERRLVSRNWKPYKDSFTYNEKGNGNGR